MSEEPHAISKVAPAPAAQSDYDLICAALMDTERGRWFLEEYARRNRGADTRLLLAAIQRIETVVCAERDRQVQQGFRTDLLEMAQAITRTRAEVGEIRSDAPSRPESVRPESQAAPRASQARGVFAAAERIRDVAWAMRGHGFDPSTCDQIEDLAASILSASSLRDPGDRRASKLSEVLQYLEHRIGALLESSANGAAALEPAAEADRPPPEPEIALQAVSASPEPDWSIALELASEDPAPVEPPTSHHGETDSRQRLPASPAIQTTPALPGTAARTLLPDIDLRSDMPAAGAVAAGGALPTASPPPEAPAATSEPASPSIDPAADFAGEQLAALGPADAAGGEPAPIPADQAPSPAASVAAPRLAAALPAQLAAPMPQLPAADPLAELKAMSEEELIALFS
jgi:hypothetical protein